MSHAATASEESYEERRVELAVRIRQARLAKDMSRMDVAVALHGILGHASVDSVRGWEAGTREPTLRSLRALSKVLDQPVAWFMGQEE